MASVLLPDSPWGPRSFGSVHRVVTCPRVLGFQGGGRSHARINLMTSTSSATPGRLIDGGANICITGDLDSLFDVVAITPCRSLWPWRVHLLLMTAVPLVV